MHMSIIYILFESFIVNTCYLKSAQNKQQSIIHTILFKTYFIEKLYKTFV